MRNPHLVAAAALTALGLSNPVSAETKQALTPELLTQLNQIKSSAVSPDGNWLVYSVKGTDGSDLYLKSLRQVDQAATQITFDRATESELQFSNDGKELFFLANRGQYNQLWRLPLSGGEARPITNFSLDIQGYVLSPKNQHIAFVFDALPGCKTLSCTAEYIDKQAQVKHTAKVYDQLMVRHWDSWEDRLKSKVFVAKYRGETISATSTSLTAILPDWDTDIAGASQLVFTPDEQSLVFSAKATSRDQAWHTNYDLFQVEIANQQITNLTEQNKAWDAQPQFSKNGRFLAYLAMSTPGYESDRFSLMLKDLKTGQLKEVSPLWDRSVSSFKFSDDNRALYVIAQDMGQKSLFEISTNFGDVRRVYSDGYAGDLHLTGNQLVFSRHAIDAPTDFYRVNRDGSNLTQLTAVNREKLADIQMGEYKQFNFKGWNDETVHGFWIKPWNYQEGQQYPVAFLVHGGPQGSFGNMFHYRWNYQLWAAKGYAVVAIDFHGSTGYGQEFTRSISRDWGASHCKIYKKGWNTYLKMSIGWTLTKLAHWVHHTVGL